MDYDEVKISELPRATVLDGDALFEIVQGGDSLSVTTMQIASALLGDPIAVEESKTKAQTVWARSFVTLIGSSQILLGANASRVGFIVWNRVGNAQIAIDIAGGTMASLAEGRMLGAGNDYYFTGAYCSAGPITVLGTAGQIVNLWEGI